MEVWTTIDLAQTVMKGKCASQGFFIEQEEIYLFFTSSPVCGCEEADVEGFTGILLSEVQVALLSIISCQEQTGNRNCYP